MTDDKAEPYRPCDRPTSRVDGHHVYGRRGHKERICRACGYDRGPQR